MKPEHTVAAIEYLLNGLTTEQLQQLEKDLEIKSAEVADRILNCRSSIAERQLSPALPTLQNLISTTISLRLNPNDDEANP